jgi:hypothetical protein
MFFFLLIQKIMYFISLVLENLALSTDDNEDILYCLKVHITICYHEKKRLFRVIDFVLWIANHIYDICYFMSTILLSAYFKNCL